MDLKKQPLLDMSKQNARINLPINTGILWLIMAGLIFAIVKLRKKTTLKV